MISLLRMCCAARCVGVALLAFAAVGAPLHHAEAFDLHAAAAVERARAPVRRMPRSAFVVDPTVSSVVLSPDGRHVAWLAQAGQRTQVWLQPAAGGAPRRLLADATARRLHWTRDGRWLLLEAPRQLFKLALDADAGSGLVAPLGDAQGRELLRVDDTQAAAAIVLEREGRKADGEAREWRLRRIAMDGSSRVLHRDSSRIADYALAPDGRLAFVQRVEGESLAILRVETDGRLQPVARCEQLRRCQPLATTPDGLGLWLRGNLGDDRGRGLMRLQRMAADGSITTVHADPARIADLDTVVLDPQDHQPLLAAYRSAVPANHAVDPRLRSALALIVAALPGDDLRIQVGRGEGAQWLLEARSDRQRGTRWLLHDPADASTRALFDDAPVTARSGQPAPPLGVDRLARKLAVEWQASDGMRLHGFVLLPPGRDPATLPLVTLVHGGPWGRVRPDYDSFGQFLANRGYVVFQPNFRSSTGLGRAYLLAADGDFGNGRVQQDIVDGARWLLANGIGDGARVGIAGGSFGGYATLLGLTFQPELFKVGVAFVPPPDFAWVLRWIVRNPESLELENVVPMRSMLRMLALDVDDAQRMATLHAQSPLANAGRMDRPLLLFAGGEDRRVGIAGVIEYAARLRSFGKEVTLFVDDEAGHAAGSALAREASLFVLERMLHEHLGGDAPDPPDAVLGDWLRRHLRASPNRQPSSG